MELAPGPWNLATVHASLGAGLSATMDGTLSSSGLTLHIDGPADLRDLSQLARAMNSPVLSGGIHSIRGTAQMAVTLRSNWLPQSNPAVLVAAASQQCKCANPTNSLVCSVAVAGQGSDSQCDRAAQFVPRRNPNCRRPSQSNRHSCGMEWTDGNVRAYSFRRKHSLGDILSGCRGHPALAHLHCTRPI